MSGGSLAMLLFIIIVVFGGTGILLSKCLKKKSTDVESLEQ